MENFPQSRDLTQFSNKLSEFYLFFFSGKNVNDNIERKTMFMIQNMAQRLSRQKINAFFSFLSIFPRLDETFCDSIVLILLINPCRELIGNVFQSDSGKINRIDYRKKFKKDSTKMIENIFIAESRLTLFLLVSMLL